MPKINGKSKLENILTYRTVPRTAKVPEYGARTFHVKESERSNIEAALLRLPHHKHEISKAKHEKVKIKKVVHFQYQSNKIIPANLGFKLKIANVN